MAPPVKPRSTYRQQQAAATRERIAEAARRLFASAGYGSTSMEAIAAEAGVAVRTVYAAFGAKREILSFICERWLEQARARERAAEVLAEPDPARRLRAAASWLRALYAAGFDVVMIFEAANDESAETRALLRSKLAGRNDAMDAMIASLEGHLRAPVHEVQAVYRALAAPGVYRELVEESGWTPDAFERWAATPWNASPGRAGPAGRRRFAGAGDKSLGVLYSCRVSATDPLPPDEPLAKRVTTGLAKVGLALKQQAWAEAGGRGLTPTQGQVLALLRANPDGLRLGELAGQLGVTAATTSDSVSALQRKGLVAKAPLAGDGRGVVVRLTPAGAGEAAAAAAWPDFLLEAVGELSAAEQAGFLRGLVTMIRTLQEKGRIPVARMCVSCTFFRPFRHDDPVRPHHCAFVDAPFGDGELRLDCPDHRTAPADQATRTWEAFRGPADARRTP